VDVVALAARAAGSGFLLGKPGEGLRLRLRHGRQIKVLLSRLQHSSINLLRIDNTERRRKRL
jgi:hypothetical protein